MSLTVAPTLQTFYAALASFIATVTGLPASNVVQGLPNRASMPLPGFVMFQAVNRRRLRFNIDTFDTTDSDPTQSTIEEGLELTVQIDCYGPQSTDATVGACDWANMLSATLRDAYGCSFFEAVLAGCDPLYADEARMSPLVDGEDQYEERWSLDARFQLDVVTTIPQGYAEALDIELINVEEAFS